MMEDVNVLSDVSARPQKLEKVFFNYYFNGLLNVRFPKSGI